MGSIVGARPHHRRNIDRRALPAYLPAFARGPSSARLRLRP
jgi:hypothetical protein